MRWLLDTNIVLYLMGGKLADPLPTGDYLVSVITELELLRSPGWIAPPKTSSDGSFTRLWLRSLRLP